MVDTREPIVVALPLRGEWLSPATPGTKIPSHGTDRFGTRYAYDFIRWIGKERAGLPIVLVCRNTFFPGFLYSNITVGARIYMPLSTGSLSRQRMAIRNGNGRTCLR